MGLYALKNELKLCSSKISVLITKEHGVIRSIQSVGETVNSMENVLYTVQNSVNDVENFSNALDSLQYNVSTQLEQYLLFYTKELQAQQRFISDLKTAYNSLKHDTEEELVKAYIKELLQDDYIIEVAPINLKNITNHSSSVMLHIRQLTHLKSETAKALNMISIRK